MGVPLQMKQQLLRIRVWLAERLPGVAGAGKSSGLHVGLSCLAVFCLALGVRFLHWQDLNGETAARPERQTRLSRAYEREATRMLGYRWLLVPPEPRDPGDARLVVHPPGYSMLFLAIYGERGPESGNSRVLLMQVVADAITASLICLIAAQLLPLSGASLAGVLASVSPHLAYYSLWLTPDALTALPIVLGVYLVTLTARKPRPLTTFGAGVSIGLSCWLRGNSLLLAPFAAVALLMLLEPRKRIGHAAILVGGTALVISPITIRNWIVYDRFIPLTIVTGLNLVEGIGAFDREGRFGMHWDDREIAHKEAEWHGRPDYAGSLWFPDGVERDRYRFAKGLGVIKDNPAWFAGTMLRRAAFMFSYNDSRRVDWPLNTARVPVISANPPFGHTLAGLDDKQPIWSSLPAELAATGTLVSRQAVLSVEADQRIRVVGDASEFGHQFATAPIQVKPDHDYLLRLSAEVEGPSMAAAVTSVDRRITLASEILIDDRGRRRRRKARTQEAEGRSAVDESQPRLVDVPFAAGDRTEVRLVMSNNEEGDMQPVARIGRAELIELGPTPGQWTRLPRALLRGLQKNLFNTGPMRALIIAGIALMLLAGRGSALVLLALVPVYYVTSHSAFSTEYRYIVGMHYFLMVFVSVTLVVAWMVLKAASQQAVAALKRQRTTQ